MKGSLKPLSFFIVGVLLPGGLLSFFAWNSLQSEDRLLQKEIVGHHAAAADALLRRVEEVLGPPLLALEAAAGTPAIRSFQGPVLLPELAALRRLGEIPVQATFVADAAGALAFPPPPPPAFPSGAEPSWGPLEQEIHRLEKLEFVEKKHLEALQGYKTLRTRPLPDALDAALLKMAAGAARKAGDSASARDALETLAARYDILPDPVGVPSGLLALRLMAAQEGPGRPDRTRVLWLDIYEGLILRRWPLDDAGRRSGVDEAFGALEALFGGAEAKDRARWTRLGETASRLENLEKIVRPLAAAPDVRRFLSEGRRGFLHRQGAFLAATPVTDERGARRGSLAALLPAAPLMDRLKAAWGEEARLQGVRLGEMGEAAPEGWHVVAVRRWEAVSPPLAFQVWAPLTPRQQGLMKKRRRLYGGLVALSLSAAAAGLFLTLRAARRERENAQLKADFVANVSHELRTPLASISYIGERLAGGRYRTPEEAREFCEMLVEETDRLKGLVGDVLDFAKMEEGRRIFQKEPLDLGDLAYDAMDRFLGKARSQGFTVDPALPEAPLPIVGDRAALIQAVMNLLDNALKYSGDSRRIVLAAGREEGDPFVSVRDFGIGVPPGEQGKIFDKFYRVESSMARAHGGGVGLGLALVKRITDAHGARVRVESPSGGGSLFTIRFPPFS